MVEKYTVKESGDFARRLAGWFRGNARDLPWRRQPSLYGTVVSEFMLQQTQVKTVLAYYERWMKALPDFATLAKAEEAEVLKLWEGLGYYRRARNLQKLARQWVEAGEKPVGMHAWLDYPGVGAYTAAAIASIAQGEKAAVVDGNVVRILARLRADAREYPDGTVAARTLTPLADALMAEAEDPAVHNEAMMELGATVCVRSKPRCLLCPVRQHCLGYASGEPEQYPRLRARGTVERTVPRLWVVTARGLLLHQRAAGARRLAGLFELPEVVTLFPEGMAPAWRLLKTGKRGIANERISEPIYAVEAGDDLLGRVALDTSLVWVPEGKLETVTLTGPHRRWVRELWGRA